MEATKAAPIILQIASQLVFHPDEPEFSPPVIPDRARWPGLPASAGASLTDHALTNTATPDTTTPAAISIGQINSNHARPRESKNATPRLPSYTESGVTSAVSSGESDDESEYVESPKNLPMRSANTAEL